VKHGTGKDGCRYGPQPAEMCASKHSEANGLLLRPLYPARRAWCEFPWPESAATRNWCPCCKGRPPSGSRPSTPPLRRHH